MGLLLCLGAASLTTMKTSLTYDLFSPPPRLDFWMPDRAKECKQTLQGSCQRKVSYRSKAAADHARIRMENAGIAKGKRTPYQCTVCGKFHLATLYK